GNSADDKILGIQVTELIGFTDGESPLLGPGGTCCQYRYKCNKYYPLHLYCLSLLKYIKQLLIFVKRHFFVGLHLFGLVDAARKLQGLCMARLCGYEFSCSLVMPNRRSRFWYAAMASNRSAFRNSGHILGVKYNSE